METDKNDNALIAGAMYCCVVVEYNGTDNVLSYGSLVRYGSDGTLYCVDYDDDENINPYYDYLEPQNTGIDSRFIFS